MLAFHAVPLGFHDSLLLCNMSLSSGNLRFPDRPLVPGVLLCTPRRVTRQVSRRSERGRAGLILRGRSPPALSVCRTQR